MFEWMMKTQANSDVVIKIMHMDSVGNFQEHFFSFG